MGDEKLFLKASEELKEGKVDQALWTKALTLEKGDEEQAKYRYMMLRVDQMKTTGHSAAGEGLLTQNGESPAHSGLRFLFTLCILGGIAAVVYIYFFNFDRYSEEQLVQMTPFWAIPIIFGYYGFYALYKRLKMYRRGYDSVTELLQEERSLKQGLWGAFTIIFLHTPIMATKSVNPLLIGACGSVIWGVMLILFFQFIFPML